MNEKKELKDLNLLDRFLFAEATEDPEILEMMLEIILGKEVVLKEMPHAEKEIRRSLWGKKVRLDVLSKDEANNLYNAEAQKENTGALPKRSRYYHGMIDSKLLPIGETDYNKLNDVTIIIISPFDLFGEGLFKYTFRMMSEEIQGLELNDGATRIFLNTNGINTDGISQELIDLLRFIENSNEETALLSTSDKVHRIHEKVTVIKQSEEVGIRYMNAWEEQVMNQQKGKYEEKLETAKRLKAMGLSTEQIQQATELTLEEIERV